MVYSCSRMCRTIIVRSYPRMGHTTTNMCMGGVFFVGTIKLDMVKHLENLGTPCVVNSSFGWYITIGYGQIGWLKELPCPDACPFCDQAKESICHLLDECILTGQVWALIFQKLGLVFSGTSSNSESLLGWWRKTNAAAPNEIRKGFNTLIILVAWEVRKHRNDCVFRNVRSKVQEVISVMCTKGGLWCLVGPPNSQSWSLSPRSCWSSFS